MALPATDDFTGASNYTALGSRTNWTDILSGITTFGAALYTSGAGEHCAYWDADTFSDSQYSQAEIISERQYRKFGVSVFCQSATADYYAFHGDRDGSSIIKVVSGTPTELLGSLGAFANTDVVKLTTSVSGGTTTLEAFINDVSQGSTTDTTYTSGSAGVAGNGDSGTGNVWDNWEGGDLAGGTSVNANTDILTLTEYPATVNAETSITSNVDILTLTEQQATISLGVTVNASTDALTLTEYPATVTTVAGGIVTNVHALTLVEYPATVNAETSITTNVDTLTLTTYPAVAGLELGVTIDGSPSLVVSTNYGAVTLYFNGTSYFTI